MAETENASSRQDNRTSPTPLLKTKLSIPVPQPNLLARPRLVDRLDEAVQLGHKLVLVSAPAGFGKTTLLASWAARWTAAEPEDPSAPKAGRAAQNPAMGWVSLDEGDDDPARFLAYVARGMQAFHPEIGEGLLEALRGPQSPPMEALLAALVNEMVAALASTHAPGRHHILVLDDYHRIKALAVHKAVTFLIDRFPPHVQLVIASRADPPLPLARLRGRGQLTELRAADLRFTLDEAAGFFRQVMGVDLSTADVAELGERTEGWITGLQLAALSLRHQDKERIPAFVQDFRGSHRFVLDYLVEEVLEHQSEAIQAFLLQTSILEHLCGPLCNAVTGSDDSQSTLENLERANLFVIPLDSTRKWYRYHHLFRDLLRARAGQRGVERGYASDAELHRRASRWYQDNRLIPEAIGHALKGHDLDQAASLIEEHGMEMLLNGELTPLLGWLNALPEESIGPRPWLCIYHAWALVLSGHLDAVESRLEGAAKAAPERALLGHAAAIRAYLAGMSGRRTRAIELAQEALHLLPDEELAIRAVVSYTLGGTCLLAGDVAGASRAFTEASVMGRKSGNLHVAVPALCNAARLQVDQGELGQAAEEYRRALRWATGNQGKLLPIAASALSGLGEVQYEWNDLESAARHLEQGIELGLRWGNLEALASDYGALARVYHAQGREEEAYRTLWHAERLLQERGGPASTLGRVAAYRARLQLARGDLAAAAIWAHEYGATVSSTFEDLREFENLTLARVWLAQGETSKATTLLTGRLLAAERSGRHGRTLEILVLQALVRQTQGDHSQALASLERALTLAAPQRYVRTLVDEGEPMARLLLAFSRQFPDVLSDYVTRLCAATTLPTTHGKPAGEPPSLNMVEPLTERELEVLELVAQGLTNRQIAERLVVAVSTVKSHTNSIYGKLDVQNRTQAIARARALHLLQ